MLNIVVPMAGRGSRFSQVGYQLPKPLLPVHGRSMITLVIENLRPTCEHRFIFVCQREHIERHDIGKVLQAAAPGASIVPIDSITEGAACTVLLAQDQIDNEHPLMVANCDQYVAVDMDDYLDGMRRGDYDGYIMTMTANDPKWSFVRLDAGGAIVEVVEKKVVSNEATVGIYNYRRGADFVRAAKTMIANNERVNNEFYVAPVYNQLLRQGQRIGFMNIGSDRDGMYGLGVPEDLTYFTALPGPPGGHLRPAR